MRYAVRIVGKLWWVAVVAGDAEEAAARGRDVLVQGGARVTDDTALEVELAA